MPWRERAMRACPDRQDSKGGSTDRRDENADAPIRHQFMIVITCIGMGTPSG